MLLFYSRGQPGVVFDHMNYYVTFISQAQLEAVFGLDSQKKKKKAFHTNFFQIKTSSPLSMASLPLMGIDILGSIIFSTQK